MGWEVLGSSLRWSGCDKKQCPLRETDKCRSWRVARNDGNQNLITATMLNSQRMTVKKSPVPSHTKFSPVIDRPIAPVKFLRPRLVRRAIRSPRAAPHELNWVLPWNIHQVAAPRDARTHGPTAGYREALGPACRLVFHESEPWDAAALPTRTGECLDARRARARPPLPAAGDTRPARSRTSPFPPARGWKIGAPRRLFVRIARPTLG